MACMSDQVWSNANQARVIRLWAEGRLASPTNISDVHPQAITIAAMYFEVVGEIKQIEVIATGLGVRERRRLSRAYGRGSWRKLKGIASVKLTDGVCVMAELHWYEAHGIGKKEFKIKRLLAQAD